MKVSEYIADFFVSKGITQCFSVTGGFAMHLNDAFGEKLDVVYPHGENPCGYAAVGYSKVCARPCVVCTTAGCGATNAVTPCLIAYQDSVPVFFISGAVPSKENVRALKHSTRTYSGSDCDIISMVKNITKFSYELHNPGEVDSVLQQCVWHMTEGRPGPIWLSVPLDVQSMQVPQDQMVWTPESETPTRAVFPIDAWVAAKRPVIIAGNGIHLSKTEDAFASFVRAHKVPVVSTFFGTDLVPEYNIGRIGVIGDRAGNFTIQNADFVLALGTNMAKSVVGYRPEWFARDARVVSVNIENVHFGEVVHMDLRDFFTLDVPVQDVHEWFDTTLRWRTQWARELPNPTQNNCPYTQLHEFYNKKPPGGVCVASSGSIFCVNWHQFLCKDGDRFIASSHGDMGFELPCAIGCAVGSTQPVYCIVGDGSFQFNFQELQTIKTLNAPVKILYFNNGGYGAIKITQDSCFKRRFGVDVTCPDVRKVCQVYDIPYFTTVDEMLAHDGPCLVEFQCIVQQRHPRLSNQMRPDGTFDNRPFEDMFPFLDRDTFRVNMFIKEVV